MAQYQHLPIYKTTYDLLVDLMNTTKDFPRDFKYSLGEKIQNHIIELLVLIYKANSTRCKKDFIQEILSEVQFLDLFLRISYDLKIVPQAKYCVFIEKTNSIAKQAQGWLKSSSEKGPEPDYAKV
ncbi:MAG: four helix bundle protein [Candidatus Gastranaerophilaceae bacterium]